MEISYPSYPIVNKVNNHLVKRAGNLLKIHLTLSYPKLPSQSGKMGNIKKRYLPYATPCYHWSG